MAQRARRLAHLGRRAKIRPDSILDAHLPTGCSLRSLSWRSSLGKLVQMPRGRKANDPVHGYLFTADKESALRLCSKLMGRHTVGACACSIQLANESCACDPSLCLLPCVAALECASPFLRLVASWPHSMEIVVFFVTCIDVNSLAH